MGLETSSFANAFPGFALGDAGCLEAEGEHFVWWV